MASRNMKDSALYLALVASCGLLAYIKQSSIGNVSTETIAASAALIQPLNKHRTQSCVYAALNRMLAFIMSDVGL